MSCRRSGRNWSGGRRVYFRNCGLLVQELLAAKRDLKLRVLKSCRGTRS